MHTVSPTRSNPTIVRYSTRNTILFDFLNVPQPYLLPVMLSDVIKLLCWEKGWRQKLAPASHRRSDQIGDPESAMAAACLARSSTEIT